MKSKLFLSEHKKNQWYYDRGVWDYGRCEWDYGRGYGIMIGVNGIVVGV